MIRKIIFHYMTLVVIGIAVTAFFTSLLIQGYYKQEIRDNLKNIALLVRENVMENMEYDKSVNYENIAQKYAKLLSKSNNINSPKLINISFLDSDGKIIGESVKNTDKIENFNGFKEVANNLNSDKSNDILYINSDGYEIVYTSVPESLPKTYIKVASPLFNYSIINEAVVILTSVGVIAAIIMTVLLALRFSYKIIRPINELIDVSEEISVGNYKKRVSISSKDEFGKLATSFNDMALRLEKTMAEMLDKSVKVESIIESMPSGIVAVDTEWRIILINSIACEIFGIKKGQGIIGINIIELIRNTQINSLLKESIEKNSSLMNEIIIGTPAEKVLRIYANPIKSKNIDMPNLGGLIFVQDITAIRKLEQIRTEFVSNVTHELKTPLTSIRGFIETLRSGALNDSEVAERFLEIIDIEAERLSILINDILQLSEIEAKHKDVNIGNYNLKMIVDEVFSILEGYAEKKSITLHADIDESIQIEANRNRIKQMLINLVDNGIKYNFHNGSVYIHALKNEGKLIITVKDTGIGIPPEHITRVFERFYRVDKGRSRNMGGTGLGLSIVKHIVNLYSGDIKITSEPGAGTQFTISLPV
ncbi:MAG TPA: ATP-binding protein [Clostridia bacterium]